MLFSNRMKGISNFEQARDLREAYARSSSKTVCENNSDELYSSYRLLSPYHSAESN